MTDEELSTASARLHEELARCGIETAPGLTNSEFTRSENEYAIKFPPDLRAFLQYALPVSRGWAEWRGDEDALRERLSWPLKGLLADIEFNGFWREDWGAPPPKLRAAVAVAREQVAAAPLLIPIFGHRYIPSEPLLPGNPVISVHQSDIIYCGANLADYFDSEFYGKGAAWTRDTLTGAWTRGTGIWVYRPADTAPPRPVRFWDDFL